jgi:hypothetical protein
MYQMSDCGLLIVAYARAANVKEIIKTATNVGITRIYIALDCSGSNIEIRNLQNDIREFVIQFNAENKVRISILERSTNVGCSANLLSGIDWAFEFEEYIAIVEDDCLPVDDFYSLVLQSRARIEMDPSIWIVGGTQVVNSDFVNRALLSRYPITWGWATSRTKWIEIRSALINGSKTYMNFVGSGIRRSESLYWRAGARRSYSGFIDAWDIPFALAFIRNNKFCILPSESLVENVGDDSFALHTNPNSSGIRIATGILRDELSTLERSLPYEEWIRKNHYRIRRRYLVTNNIRKFIDLSTKYFKNLNRKPLIQSWHDAKV